MGKFGLSICVFLYLMIEIMSNGIAACVMVWGAIILLAVLAWGILKIVQHGKAR